MTKDEALKLALEALEDVDGIDTETECVTIDVGEAITAVREALAQPEQEPDAPDIVVVDDSNSQTNTMSWAINLPLPIGTSLYTSPPASKPLTDAQIGAVAADIWGSILIAPQSHQEFAHAIEAKLKEKNT